MSPIQKNSKHEKIMINDIEGMTDIERLEHARKRGDFAEIERIKKIIELNKQENSDSLEFLKLLEIGKAYNAYNIERSTGHSYSSINKHLIALERLGFLQMRKEKSIHGVGYKFVWRRIK